MTTRILTGITTTGTPHLGNYAGAIRPAIVASQQPGAAGAGPYLFRVTGAGRAASVPLLNQINRTDQGNCAAVQAAFFVAAQHRPFFACP